MKLVEFAEIVSAMAKLHPEAEVLGYLPEWDCFLPIAVSTGEVVLVEKDRERYYKKVGVGTITLVPRLDALLLEYA